MALRLKKQTSGRGSSSSSSSGLSCQNFYIIACAVATLVYVVYLSLYFSNRDDFAVITPTKIRPLILEIYHHNENCDGGNVTTVQLQDGEARLDKTPKALRVLGPGEVQLFQHDLYVASVVEMEGCMTMYPLPAYNRAVLVQEAPKKQVDVTLQKKYTTTKNTTHPKTWIVFSTESAEGFGYQATTSAYAFLNSNQTHASWLRLMTSHIRDDLADQLPTFTAPRTLYSRRYVPINKPDILEKWLASPDAPSNPNDVLAVVDPDNWLLLDLYNWTSRVSSGNTVGQGAYYATSPLTQGLWKEVCLQGCENKVVPVGVPYILTVEDMRKIAPIWRRYTILLNEKRHREGDDFEKKYKELYMAWTSEMFGYNFACAHLGINTEMVEDLQIRDVEWPRGLPYGDPVLSKRPMLHMGRAWFPKSAKEQAEKWRHTEGKDFSDIGIQVWCKCNVTASEIMPWPVPEGLDFQSFHTLRLMHEASEWFGPIPKNLTLRPKDRQSIP